MVSNQGTIPRGQVVRILREVHDCVSGEHLSMKKILLKVRQRFYWLGYKKNVEDWCRKCTACKLINGQQARSMNKMKLRNMRSLCERNVTAIKIARPSPSSKERKISVVYKSMGSAPAKVSLGRKIASDFQERLGIVYRTVWKSSLSTDIKMKTRYECNTKTSDFEEVSLVWLHNPVLKTGKSPKFEAPILLSQGLTM